MKKETYQKSIETIFKDVNSSEQGLTNETAKQRLAQNGPNALKEAAKASNLKLFLETFKDAMVIVLLVVAVVQMVMGPILNQWLFLRFYY